jgi:hypothetical protein
LLHIAPQLASEDVITYLRRAGVDVDRVVAVFQGGSQRKRQRSPMFQQDHGSMAPVLADRFSLTHESMESLQSTSLVSSVTDVGCDEPLGSVNGGDDDASYVEE